MSGSMEMTMRFATGTINYNVFHRGIPVTMRKWRCAEFFLKTAPVSCNQVDCLKSSTCARQG
jgi:hypothetical protein